MIGVIHAGMLCAAAGAILATATPANARAVSREDFAFVEGRDARIVVFRPDVHVGSLAVGGLDQPNAEWTEAARGNIQDALIAAGAAQNAKLDFIDELEGENADILNQYRALFETVAGAMALHVQTDRLATKEWSHYDREAKRTIRGSRIDWSLGEGAARLREITGADYAMFVYTYDSYGDAGRKAAQVAGMLGCVIGACVIINAGVHVGYAGLVELETGNIVWFNTDPSIGGDPREAEGAVTRVEKLMEDFPQPQPATDIALADTQ